MKYEAVFGNQELFDGAETFTGLDVVVHSISSGIKSYARLSDLTPESLRNHPVCAMRRIIAEPKRWTVEDQKAGRLPEVGMIGALKNGREIEYLGESVGGTLHHVRFVDDSECIRISLFDFFPIETPEEKAERLRMDWCKTAASIFASHPSNSTTESMNDVYKAMLSGDLPVPVKGGE